MANNESLSRFVHPAGATVRGGRSSAALQIEVSILLGLRRVMSSDHRYYYELFLLLSCAGSTNSPGEVQRPTSAVQSAPLSCRTRFYGGNEY